MEKAAGCNYEEREGTSEDERSHFLSLKDSTQRRCLINNIKELLLFKEFYKNTRRKIQVVTVNVLCFELKRLFSPADEDISVLRYRVYRWLCRGKIVQLQITYVSQNTKYDTKNVKDIACYVNDQIVCGKYLKIDVVNIDETNINFDMTGTMTLADYGLQTVSICIAETSTQCIVLLGVTMDGTKLPPFIFSRASFLEMIFLKIPCMTYRIKLGWTGVFLELVKKV